MPRHAHVYYAARSDLDHKQGVERPEEQTDDGKEIGDPDIIPEVSKEGRPGRSRASRRAPRTYRWMVDLAILMCSLSGSPQMRSAHHVRDGRSARLLVLSAQSLARKAARLAMAPNARRPGTIGGLQRGASQRRERGSRTSRSPSPRKEKSRMIAASAAQGKNSWVQFSVK